jgi:hypothetical protein
VHANQVWFLCPLIQNVTVVTEPFFPVVAGKIGRV